MTRYELPAECSPDKETGDVQLSVSQPLQEVVAGEARFVTEKLIESVATGIPTPGEGRVRIERVAQVGQTVATRFYLDDGHVVTSWLSEDLVEALEHQLTAGWRPAQPDDTPGQVEPDDAQPQPQDLTQLREQLAAIEHQRWADWQSYMHSQCYGLPYSADSGALVIPRELVERWERQSATPYAELSEAEKDSDRRQVDRYWPIVAPLQRKASLFDSFTKLTLEQLEELTTVINRWQLHNEEASGSSV